MGETSKADIRRWAEDWFGKFVKAPGLDIGGGTDPIDPTRFTNWDYQWVTKLNSSGHYDVINEPGDRNAQTLSGLADNSFNTVYASHILEHLEDPREALRNWWRVLSPGGHLIVCVPHRDLYEKKKTKPSRWNPHTRAGGGGHQTFWLPETDEAPDTLSFKRVLTESLSEGEFKIVDFRTVDDGYDYSLPENVHPVGEYAIEAVILKAFR